MPEPPTEKSHRQPNALFAARSIRANLRKISRATFGTRKAIAFRFPSRSPPLLRVHRKAQARSCHFLTDRTHCEPRMRFAGSKLKSPRQNNVEPNSLPFSRTNSEILLPHFAQRYR